MRDIFLRELWEIKARDERPRSESEFEKMRRLVEGNEKLEKLSLKDKRLRIFLDATFSTFPR